jgi:TusA-related sulfurtransferase
MSPAIPEDRCEIGRTEIRDLLEVTADCPTFEKDVRQWCENEEDADVGKDEGGGKKRRQIQF